MRYTADANDSRPIIAGTLREWQQRALAAEARVAELEDEVERLTAELEEWRSGKRQRSHVDSILDGFGVDDIEDLFT